MIGALVSLLLSASPTISAIDVIQASTKGTSITPTLPSGYAANDILMFQVWCRTTTCAISETSGGWTSIWNGAPTGGSPTTSGALYWKRAASASETAPTFTFGASQDAFVRGWYVSGAITTENPFTVKMTETSVPTGDGSLSSWTPIYNEVLLIFIWSDSDNLSSGCTVNSTNPTNFTGTLDTNATGSDMSSCVAAAAQTGTAGATGVQSYSLSGTQLSATIGVVYVHPDQGGGPTCVDHSGMGFWGCF